MILRELGPHDEQAFETVLDDWTDAPGISIAYGLIRGQSFESYLSFLRDLKDGHNLALDQVPDTSLYAFVGEEIVGRVSVRHRLNQQLLEWGGHIGYIILEKYRGRGLATKMLAASFPYCRSLGLEKILISCDESNVASGKVILKNGGTPDGFYDFGDHRPRKLRYWISLTSQSS